MRKVPNTSSSGLPPTDGKGLTISGKFKKFEGPVLNCRGSTRQFGLNTNGLVIDEIRNISSAMFHNFLSAVVQQNSSSCGKIPLRPFPSVGGRPELLVFGTLSY